MSDLPNDLEFFLISHGFFEPERAPGSKRHAPIKHPKKEPERVKPWMPSYPGEEPPF